jgi:4'-phosphopantetheinyl transferase EntD
LTIRQASFKSFCSSVKAKAGEVQQPQTAANSIISKTTKLKTRLCMMSALKPIPDKDRNISLAAALPEWPHGCWGEVSKNERNIYKS